MPFLGQTPPAREPEACFRLGLRSSVFSNAWVRPPIVIIRHPKEKLSKCSLEPLRGRDGFRFMKAKPGVQFDATGYTLLAVDAPEISVEDAGRPLLLLDSTWRLLPAVERCVSGEPVRRSLPAWLRTAYPRVSKISQDPDQGLASVEALYAACRLMGFPADDLLDQYRWAHSFVRQFEDHPGQGASGLPCH